MESLHGMTGQATLILKNDLSEVERVVNWVSDLSVRNSIPPKPNTI